MTTETKTVHYTYEEREAIKVIRKSMLRKPAIIAEIMKDASREMAVRVMLQAKTELAQLLDVSRAFTAAASVLAQQQKESKDDQARQD